MSARDRILGRVRAAVDQRPRTDHPGPFPGGRPGPSASSPIEGFAALFTAAGGEVHHCSDFGAARDWLSAFAADFASVSVGRGIDHETVAAAGAAATPTAPDEASLGVSRGLGCVAETGSLILDARDGRRTQLLPPTHVVLVEAADAFSSLRDALDSLRSRLPSAIGLHSGPSKSADIGQILVRGVHGPGRVIALVVGDHPTTEPS